ncbi:unnamed protein product (macronuclear) [Paramecium tetraurelia]|uniref:Uncharacterized protein n=1 Tax=Paramecium tetraurelia TaxID=5888 RepID=A0DLT0_PARTE|nr:uncharacterized protein GSPATT00039629001 [Paramecium tetraurelia]CAK83997.1 unnamed protein product [Paramecium tetraurelia]|eukprot:XP_001451394.1 hypothetical protein (macronuclear) [Paramecium tetraurelia strain d4-2]
MLDQCQYFTQEQSHQFLGQRIEKRMYPRQYRAKNRLLSQLLGKIEIKPMPFEIMSITNMSNASKDCAESDNIQDNLKLFDDQEKTEVPHTELQEKARQCCNLLECSKEDIQDVGELSQLFGQIIEILQQSKQKNLYFITPYNFEVENKQRRLMYNSEALTNLIKRLKAGRLQTQTKSLFRSRIQTQSIGKQIQKTELNEQLSVQALNLLNN